MSLLRPVVAGTHNQGAISQPFLGTFWWEHPGYVQKTSVANRGKREDFLNARYYVHIHEAIDYICVEGTHCRAMKSGTCIGHGRDSIGAYFDYIRLRLGTEFQVVSLSYHLKANSFTHSVGAHLLKGQTHALTGDTPGPPYTTGPHLHEELIRARRGAGISEIFRDGLRYDPQPFIDGTASLRQIAP